MTNLQLGGKMKKDVFACSVTSVERRKKIGLTIFLTLLTHGPLHEAFDTADPSSLRGVCHI